MSANKLVANEDLRRLHEATTTLRTAISTWLGDLVPPYTDEVLYDLAELTARPDAERAEVQRLLDEAAGVMEMLPAIPAEWETLRRAATTGGYHPPGSP